MSDNPELLRRYAEERSEAAFAEFVRRNVDFVYGSALRRLGGDTQLAEDVTQQVFETAARNARQLARHPVLSGWLFTATRNVAAQAVRTEQRRRARELQALAMNQPTNDTETDWERLRPALDEALDHLGESDRQAVLLRFFENRSFGEIGAQLRVAENTARMRVDRALDRLSVVLRRRGVTSTSTALAIALASQPGVAAPVGLAASATAAALAGKVGAGGTAATVLLMGMTKIQVGLIAAILVAGSAGWVIQGRQIAHWKELARQPAGMPDATDVAVENRRLRQAQYEATERDRADAAKLTQLRQEATELRQRIAALNPPKPSSARSTVSEPVFEASAVEKKPTPTVRLRPIYPFEMRKLGINGKATIDFIVAADGTVHDARVLTATDPAFGEAALDGVKRWQYAPGQVRGQAVATHLQLPVTFILTDEGHSGTGSTGGQQNRHVPWF